MLKRRKKRIKGANKPACLRKSEEQHLSIRLQPTFSSIPHELLRLFRDHYCQRRRSDPMNNRTLAMMKDVNSLDIHNKSLNLTCKFTCVFWK